MQLPFQRIYWVWFFPPVEFFLYANDTLWRNSELHLGRVLKLVCGFNSPKLHIIPPKTDWACTKPGVGISFPKWGSNGIKSDGLLKQPTCTYTLSTPQVAWSHLTKKQQKERKQIQITQNSLQLLWDMLRTIFGRSFSFILQSVFHKSIQCTYLYMSLRTPVKMEKKTNKCNIRSYSSFN